MPEENLINQETPSATPSAERSAEEELLPTSEAAKVAGTSARTLKRRADLGTLRRTSVHTPFGIENRYYKNDLEKLKEEMQQKHAEVAEVLAEVAAEHKGRRADGADPQPAGGDTKSLFIAEAAEVAKVIDQKIAKLTEPFYKLANTLEIGFDRLLHFHEQTTRFQDRLIEIETTRDQEKQKEREEAKEKEKREQAKNRIIIITYIVTTIIAAGVFGYLFWLMYSGRLFGH